MYKNQHEKMVFETISKTIKNLQPYNDFKKDDKINQIRVENNPLNKVLLFREYGTSFSNTTELGNPIKKEIMLFFPRSNHQIWIEVRHLKKRTQMTDFTFGEIIRSEDYGGDLWMILLGNGFTEKVLQSYEKELHKRGLFGKVKLIRNITELEILLKDELEFEHTLL
jgi:hypothetical protein